MSRESKGMADIKAEIYTKAAAREGNWWNFIWRKREL